jgi:Transposase IS4
MDNKVLCCQWVDSKVVNVGSSFFSLEVAQVYPQISSNRTPFTCHDVVVRYQRNMLVVDKSDQMRAAGGVFAAKAHYQKWYKRTYFALLDMITLNALIVWNMSTQAPTRRRIGQRTVLKRHDFL